MPEGKKYSYIRLEEAKNGFMLSWDEKVLNPTVARNSTFESPYNYKSETKLFEAGHSVSMEQAYDNAAMKMKEMYMDGLEDS